MADNRQENTPAEIYANVRNRALEEAEDICMSFSRNPMLPVEQQAIGLVCACHIRALKTDSE